MDVVLISTYELGHQPFGLASPAVWLQSASARVTCLMQGDPALAEYATATKRTTNSNNDNNDNNDEGDDR